MTRHFNARARGRFRNSWLNSHHTFSFGEFYDLERMGYRSLRVINEDTVAPAEGFATHGHHDMEIITYVLAGELAHNDSIGNGSIIRPGEIQRMSAGTGIRHSEMNPSHDAPVHFLQIWIEPRRQGCVPSYEQMVLPPEAGVNEFTPIATPDGNVGAISLNQDAVISVAKPERGEIVDVALGADRYGFLHIVKGDIAIDGKAYCAGDGLAFNGAGAPFTLKGQASSEVLFFDLA